MQAPCTADVLGFGLQKINCGLFECCDLSQHVDAR